MISDEIVQASLERIKLSIAHLPLTKDQLTRMLARLGEVEAIINE